MNLSVVCPVYYGENTIKVLTERIFEACENIFEHIEIICINDASPDNSWNVIQSLCAKDKRIIGVNLSRNFGQHYAITAGLKLAKGDWIVVMDCDLQDRPEEIPHLYKKAKQGFDIVYAQRIERKDAPSKKLSSILFYKTFGYLTNSKQDSSIANFGIYSKKVIDAILSLKDKIRYFPTMVQWVGFESSKIQVQHDARSNGKSSYNWSKLFKMAFDNIISFSDKPLHLTVRFGFFIAFISFFIGMYYIIKYILGDIEVLGFTSIIISISFFSGIIIFILGIIGIYLGKTFEQTKNRPTYIINEIINKSTFNND